MKYRLEKNYKLSGDKASIYNVYLYDEDDTLFNRFVAENKSLSKDELKDIVKRLNTIANKTGAREQFFKVGEGGASDNIDALYDKPGSKLRLYCIRYGEALIILGGGGPKPKGTRTWQDDEKLSKEMKLLKRISQDIYQKQLDKDLWLKNDGMDFDGNLEFEDDD